MWAKEILLCLCAATLALAIPIKTDKSIIKTASDLSATRSEDMDFADKIPTLQEGKGRMLIPALFETELLGKDKIKTRIRRGIFRVKCPAGEIKIGGICMNCQDMGTC